MFMGRDLIELDDKEMRQLCGAEIAMVFQDPMSSLNPVMTIGKQITESLRLHLKMSRHEAQASRPSRCCARSTSPRPSGASTSTRTSCRAACASA